MNQELTEWAGRNQQEFGHFSESPQPKYPTLKLQAYICNILNNSTELRSFMLSNEEDNSGGYEE
jgi:hypothetical protein